MECETRSRRLAFQAVMMPPDAPQEGLNTNDRREGQKGRRFEGGDVGEFRLLDTKNRGRGEQNRRFDIVAFETIPKTASVSGGERELNHHVNQRAAQKRLKGSLRVQRRTDAE